MVTKASKSKLAAPKGPVQKIVGQGKTGTKLTPRHPGTNNTGWGGVGKKS